MYEKDRNFSLERALADGRITVFRSRTGILKTETRHDGMVVTVYQSPNFDWTAPAQDYGSVWARPVSSDPHIPSRLPDLLITRLSPRIPAYLFSPPGGNFVGIGVGVNIGEIIGLALVGLEIRGGSIDQGVIKAILQSARS